MHMTLPQYKVRRNLLVLRAERGLGGAGDAAVRRALQAYLDKLPSGMELMMMPDPGGWRETVEIERASVEALVASAPLRAAVAARARKRGGGGRKPTRTKKPNVKNIKKVEKVKNVRNNKEKKEE